MLNGEKFQHGIPTIRNSLSVQDYFAEKMKRLKQKSREEMTTEEEPSSVATAIKKKKRKEKRKESGDAVEVVEEGEEQ